MTWVRTSIVAGALGLSSLFAGCAAPKQEPTAVQTPEIISLEAHVRRAFERPETLASIRKQYFDSKQNGLEWGGVLIENARGTEYVPIQNTFANDLQHIYNWHKYGNLNSKNIIDANLRCGEGNQRTERDLTNWNFPMFDFEFVRNGINCLHGADTNLAFSFMNEYHNKVQKWMYSAESIGLEAAAKRGRIVGYVHAHPFWHPADYQSSKTDRNISLTEDLVLIVPKDEHLRVFTIQKKEEKEILQTRILGEQMVLPYVDLK